MEIKKNDFHSKIYLAAYFCFILKYLLSTTSMFNTPDIIENILDLSFLLLILIKFITQKMRFFQAIALILMTVLTLYSSKNADYTSIFLSCLCIISIQDVKLEEVLKISYVTKLYFIFLSVMSYVVTYQLWPEKLVFSYRDSDIKRHFFFFGHANTFAALITWTFFEYIYVNYEKISIKHIAAILLSSLVFHKFTDSSTALYILILVLGLIVLEKNKKRLCEKILLPISKFGFMFFSMFFSFLVVIYTKLPEPLLELWHQLDESQTGRLLFGAFAYDLDGLTLLGRKIKYPSKIHWRTHWFDDIIFDNTYIWLFVALGAIYLVILSISFFVIAKKTTNIEKIFIIAYLLYAVSENYVMSVAICFPTLIIGKYIFKKLNLEETNKTDRFKKKEDIPLWKKRRLAS